MKTRVMQDEPDEPVVHKPAADPPAVERNNLAAKMARWARSATRRRSSARARS